MPSTPAQIVDALLTAYRQALFPMADLPSGRSRRRSPTIRWYSPDPRAILPLEPDALHIPRSLRRTLRAHPFLLSTDQAFERVIRACAEPRPGHGDWLDETLIAAYTLLHRAGHAHSIEAWLAAPGTTEPTLVGGIYGVHIGSAFFAESMFCRPALGGTDASKICLVQLVEHLRARGFTLLDVQLANDHTVRFGVIEIPRDDYLQRLAESTRTPAEWLPFPSPAGTITPV